MTRKQLLEKYPQNLVMVTMQFGNPIYIAPTLNGNIEVTDDINKAERWSELDTTKLQYHKAVTSYNLEFVKA